MSDRTRWRYGDTNPVVAAVDAATVIEIGDLLWQDIDDAKPGAACRDQLTAGEFQCWLANAFLGVAMLRSKSGDTAPVRVATTGVFEFDCPSGTFELGDLMSVAVDGVELHNQRVVKTDDSKSAIARVAKREPDPTSSVLVDIRSTVMTGGIIGR